MKIAKRLSERLDPFGYNHPIPELLLGRLVPALQPASTPSHGRSMKTILLLVVALTTALMSQLSCPLAVGQNESSWKGGVASIVITPSKNMWMAGYASRNKPADGKQTDLYAKALALADHQDHQLVMVTCDLIGIPRELRQNLVQRCSEAYHLPADGLLLNASHTHSGPEFRVGRGNWKEADSDAQSDSFAYGQEVEDKLFRLIGQALDKLVPVKLGYTHARAGFAMNRRLPSATGIQNSPYPDGPVDHHVPVLRVEGTDGKLLSIVFGYACHNTCLSLYQWNGDYAGYAQEYLQAAHPGTIALFMMGCGGDQNPYPRRTLEVCQQHGRTLANAVETALSVSPRLVNGKLRTAYAEVEIDYDEPPSQAEFERRLTSKDRFEAEHARRMLKKLEAGEAMPKSYPCPTQVIHLGDELVLVAIGGETCVDYSLRLKAELAGAAAVWVAGYSNDVMAYIPSRRVRLEGGYEGQSSMRHFAAHPGPWAPTLEEKIIKQVHRLHQGLIGGLSHP
jgi:neutral ceramidase